VHPYEQSLLAMPSLTMLDGPIPEPKLSRADSALLIVDMQHYAADPQRGLGRRAQERGLGAEFSYYFTEVQRIVPTIATLMRSCRAAGLEVIHLISRGRTADGRDLSREYKKRRVLTTRDAPDGDVLPQVSPGVDEIVIPKAVAGGFTGTPLDATLRSMAVRNLIVAGVATNQCVESTVREASHLGYDVILVEDGCATYRPEWQRFSLESMADQFAVVRTAADVIKNIETSNPGYTPVTGR
jgi:nicotinamidase-related amidase